MARRRSARRSQSTCGKQRDTQAADPKEVRRRMQLEGRWVIALGERDSVPGEAIAAVARSAGAEVIETRTECFV